MALESVHSEPVNPVPADLEVFGCCTLEQDGCATCGDVAVPVRVVALVGQDVLVEDRLGRRAEVATDFVPDAQPGDVLLVHMGVAIGRGDRAEGQGRSSRLEPTVTPL